MVKKLLKYEYIYYFRTFIIFFPIVLAIAAMARMLHEIHNGSIITGIVQGSAYFMLVLSCIAILVLSTAIGVIRFYKNMYSAEGYLTFTLPISHNQHIFTKLFTAISFQLASFVTVFAAVFIAVPYNSLKNVYDTFILSFGINGNPALPISFFVLYFLVNIVFTMLLYYTCITIGQMAKKNKILAAIGVYFIYYVASQIVSTTIIVIFSVLASTNAMLALEQWTEQNPMTSLYIFLGGAAALYSALAVVCWIVTKKVMTKKLNLE